MVMIVYMIYIYIYICDIIKLSTNVYPFMCLQILWKSWDVYENIRSPCNHGNNPVSSHSSHHTYII